MVGKRGKRGEKEVQLLGDQQNKPSTENDLKGAGGQWSIFEQSLLYLKALFWKSPTLNGKRLFLQPICWHKAVTGSEEALQGKGNVHQSTR